MIFVLMRQAKQLRMWVIILLGLTVLSEVGRCEEWYQPDSRLISDAEFSQFVLNDKSAFKIVKYFSPHCVYCRYLKQVVDQLKHEKEWCFRIYDFNCAWYPQHCMQNVRSASFPYTAIHNTEGGLHEEIHGFYPEPVIRTIFDRIEGLCQEATKKTTSSLTQQEAPPKEETQQPPQQAHAQAQQPAVQPKIEQKQVTHPQQNQPLVLQQKKFDEPNVDTQETQVKIEPAHSQKQKISVPQRQIHEASSNQTYLKYVVYGVTVLVAAFYFYKINKGKQIEEPNHHQSTQEASPLLDHITPPPQGSSSIGGIPKAQAQAILQAQAELSHQIADEQL